MTPPLPQNMDMHIERNYKDIFNLLAHSPKVHPSIWVVQDPARNWEINPGPQHGFREPSACTMFCYFARWEVAEGWSQEWSQNLRSDSAKIRYRHAFSTQHVIGTAILQYLGQSSNIRPSNYLSISNLLLKTYDNCFYLIVPYCIHLVKHHHYEALFWWFIC